MHLDENSIHQIRNDYGRQYSDMIMHEYIHVYLNEHTMMEVEYMLQ